MDYAATPREWSRDIGPCKGLRRLGISERVQGTSIAGGGRRPKGKQAVIQKLWIQKLNISQAPICGMITGLKRKRD